MDLTEVKSMSSGLFRKVKRLRKKNKGRRLKRRAGGKTFHTNARTYRALARRNRKPRKARSIRRMLRTKARRSKRIAHYGENKAPQVLQHNDSYLAAVIEFAQASGQTDLAASLLEVVDPAFTSTKIGIYAMDVAEKIDADAKVGPSFVDTLVLDEVTLTFVFEKADNITEEALTHLLAPFGKTDLIVKPGDALSEKETSDVYMVALTVEAKKLAGIQVEEEYKLDKAGNPVIDEKAVMSETDYKKFADDTVALVEGL